VFLCQSYNDTPRPPTNPLAFARELVAAHLLACPADASLSLKLHDAVPTLYAAVATTFPEIERVGLTPAMWEQVVATVVPSARPKPD